MSSLHRRHFLKAGSLLGLGSLVSLPSFSAPSSPSKVKLMENDIVLFQGDSITDAGRKKEAKEANNNWAMGSGYAVLAAAQLLKRFPEKKLTIYNRGISGNKVPQLAERWDADCVDLKPTVLSILIGVNDYWQTRNGRYVGTAEKYRQDYDALLTTTRQKLPNVRLIIGEPFAVPGTSQVDQSWAPAFGPYQKIAREMAEKYDAVFIPYQSVFDEACKKAPAAYWTGDGVHTTLAGAELMADAWLNALKG